GVADLVSVGQHSDVMIALGADAAHTRFPSVRFEDPTGEYMRLYGPPATAARQAPCLYTAMESAESDYSDYVRCFDDHGGTYVVDLPPGGYRMDYERVPFWDFDQDGMLDFAAHDADGKWSVFTLELAPPGPIGRTTIRAKHSGKCAEMVED